MRQYVQDKRFSSVPGEIAESINILADLKLKKKKMTKEM